MKTLTKHVLFDGKCKLDGRKFNSNQKGNNANCQYQCKKRIKDSICQNNYA